MFGLKHQVRAAKLEAELFATRARLADRDGEIQHLRARVSHLESLFEQRSIEVLNTVLNRQGFAGVGEAEKETEKEALPFGHGFTALDWRIYENWERDFLTACPEKTKEEAQAQYYQEYGLQLPSLALL